MSHCPKIQTGKRGERGSAMILALIFSVTLASVVLFATNDSMNAQQNQIREDHYSRSLSAAEYGAELAISEISSGLIKEGNGANAVVDGDWVTGQVRDTDRLGNNLYSKGDGKSAWDQRRITGNFDNQEFRVRVRSARRVYDPEKPNGAIVSSNLEQRGWLSVPNKVDVDYGTIKVWQFEDIYEITSTARDSRTTEYTDNDSWVGGTRQATPVVQAVVNFTWSSPMNDMMNIGLIHMNEPQDFRITGAYNTDYINEWPVGAESLIKTRSDVYNLAVTAEDHYLTNLFSLDYQSNKIVKPWRDTASSANFFDATGDFWKRGWLTLNYRNNPDADKPNPLRPLSYGFNGPAGWQSPWHSHMMVANPYEEPDEYFLGGKEWYGAGRTVVFQEDAAGEVTEIPNRIVKTVKVVLDEEGNPKLNTNGTVQTTTSWAFEPVSDPDTDVRVPVVESQNSGFAGGEFNIVLGNFEDLRNLYINVTNTYNYPDNVDAWTQMYVGQYTTGKWGVHDYGVWGDRNQANSQWNNAWGIHASIPAYYGTVARSHSIQLVEDINGRKLVRLYAKKNEDGTETLYKYHEKDSEWTGKYTWVHCSMEKWGNVHIDASEGDTPEDAPLNIPRVKAGEIVVVRPFFWHEVTGYALKRKADGSLDLTGDKRTQFLYLDEEKTIRKPVGFDEVFQASQIAYRHDGPKPGSDTDIARRHPLYPGQTVPKEVRELDVGENVITVYDETNMDANGNIADKTYKDMNSFLFKKKFTKDGVEVELDALALFVAFEDMAENAADWNYTDMMFTIWVAPGDHGDSENKSLLTTNSKLWWERDEREGLTGETSHIAVTANDAVVVDEELGEKELRAKNYSLLNHREWLYLGEELQKSLIADKIWTMQEEGGLVYSTFPRAYFKTVDSKYVIDEDNRHVKENLQRYKDAASADEYYHQEGHKPVFYFTDDDVMTFMVSVKDAKDNSLYYDMNTGEWRRDAAIEKIVGYNPNYTLKLIDARWIEKRNVKSGLAKEDPTSFRVPNRVVEPRRIAGQIIGYEMYDVPVVKTDDYEAGTAVPVMETVRFIAGEGAPIPATDTYKPLVDGLELSGAVAHRKDALTLPELAGDPKGDEKTYRTAVVKNLVMKTPKDAVDACYESYFKGRSDEGAKITSIHEKYGLKDNRYAIGYHRGGVRDEIYGTDFYDHYEIVSLGVEGWNAYRMAVDKSKFVAKNLQPKQYDGQGDTHKIELKYGVDAGETGIDTPTFVFNEPIDGAGAMVVNGNLVVRDTFAYHGTLVVLGDVTVIPTLKTNQLIYGADGHAMDKFGNSLRLDDTGEWYYVLADGTHTEVALDSTGAPVIENGMEVKVEPLREDLYRGELIVQGQLLVQGRINTVTVKNNLVVDENDEGQAAVAARSAGDEIVDIAAEPAYTGHVRTGVVKAYWSTETVEMISGIWAVGRETTERISWVHDDNIDVNSIWNDEYDNK